MQAKIHVVFVMHYAHAWIQVCEFYSGLWGIGIDRVGILCMKHIIANKMFCCQSLNFFFFIVVVCVSTCVSAAVHL